MKEKNIVFMGTPDFAVPILEMLIEVSNVVMVVTQPDKEVGRKKIISKSPVKKIAEENNIMVFQPERIRNDYEELVGLNIDLIVTCAYGQIVPQEVLDLPKYGAINVHASLLPKYRGSAPIQWSLINGDKETGVTLMYMDKGMDTGDIIVKKSCAIDNSDNVGTLHDKLSLLGRDLLKENLERIINQTVKRIKQNNDEATLAPMIKREDEHLDFNSEGRSIINKIRALSPWPLANFLLNDQEIKVIDAEFRTKNNPKAGVASEVNKDTLGIECLDGIIYLKMIKPFGKKEMTIKDYLNGINKEKILGRVVK